MVHVKYNKLSSFLANFLPMISILGLVLIYSCKDDEEEESPLILSDKKAIISFEILDVSATINEDDKTITIVLPANTNLTKLTPTIQVSEGATVSPSSGVATNFLTPVIYTVTAQGGTNAASRARYTVTARIEGTMIESNLINSFTLENVSPQINIENKTIMIQLPPGTNITSLAPTIVLGTEATAISPASGEAQDFTNPVTYTVTKRDNTQEVFTVTVTTNTVTLSTTFLDFGNVVVGDNVFLKFSITNHHSSLAIVNLTQGPEGRPVDQLILEKELDLSRFPEGNSTRLQPSQMEEFRLTLNVPSEATDETPPIEVMYEFSVRIRGEASFNIVLNVTAQPVPRPVGQLYVNHLATGANDGTTWENAYTDLSDALSEAGTSRTFESFRVWVAKGTYHGGFNIGSSVFLLGGFAGTETSEDQRDWVANRTILDGQGTSSHVMIISNTKFTARFLDIVMDGFDITGGAAFSPINKGYRGGGLRITQSSPHPYRTYINNCRIYKNRSSVAGAAIFISLQPTTFTNVLITDNEGGANAGSNQRQIERQYGVRGTIIESNIKTIGRSEPVKFINCTIAGNRRGPHVDFEGSGRTYIGVQQKVEFINSILWGDQEWVSGNPKLENSITNPSMTDPMLGSDLLMNPCPAAGSPAINAGRSVPNITLDINKRPRSQGSAVDMGVCEAG